MSAVGLAALFMSGAQVSDRGYVLIIFPLTGMAAIITRSVLRVGLMYVRGRGHNVRNLLILGTGPEAVRFAQTVHDHRVLGVEVVGYLGDRPPEGQPEDMYWGRIFELPHVLREEVVDEIAACVRPAEWSLVEEFVSLAHQEGEVVRVHAHRSPFRFIAAVPERP